MTKQQREAIKLSLDPKIYPETIEYLERIKNFVHLSSYDIAVHIIECDKTSAMTPELFNFAVKLFKEAIKSGNNRAMNDLGALYYDSSILF